MEKGGYLSRKYKLRGSEIELELQMKSKKMICVFRKKDRPELVEFCFMSPEDHLFGLLDMRRHTYGLP